MLKLFPPYRPGLLNALIERALRPNTFEELFSTAQQTLRGYSALSVAHEALNAMRSGGNDRRKNLEAFPWISCALLKWRLEIPGKNDVGARISTAEFDRLRQMVWDWNHMEEAKEALKSRFNLMTMVRSGLVMQSELQKAERSDIYRWPALLEELPSDHRLRRYFREIFRMEPTVYMDVTMAIFAIAAAHPEGFSRGDLAALRPAYGDAVDIVLDQLASDLDGLRQDLANSPPNKRRRRTEVTEFPFLKRRPLLKLLPDRFTFWNRSVLYCGIEEAVHLRLSDLAGDYAKPFGSVFEKYVWRLLREAGIPFFDENELKRQVGAESRVVEAVVEGPRGNVFIEAKMGLFADIPMGTDDPRELSTKLDKVLEACKQGWAVSKLVRSAQLSVGNCANAECDFLLVVTSREVYVGGGRTLDAMLSPYGPKPEPGGDEYLPLENIFVLGIDQFELLLAYVRTAEISIGEVLRDAARANSDSKTARLFFWDHIKERGMVELAAFPSQLVEDAKEHSATRLIRALDMSGASL